jgi:hypothetical protein
MIKIAYKELSNLRELPGRPGPLSRLGGTTTFDSFASRWLVGRFLKVVVEAIQEYEKALLGLGQTYGEIVPGQTDAYTIKPENMTAFNKEKAALDAITVEINFQPLPVAVVEQVALSPLDLNALEPFIAFGSQTLGSQTLGSQTLPPPATPVLTSVPK